VRGIRGAVLSTVVACGVTTAAVLLLPQMRSGYRRSALHLALETAASLVVLLAGFLIFGRLRRRALLNELTLVAALAVLALSDLVFGTLPLLEAPDPSGLVAQASLIGSVLGACLFALAAFVPRYRLARSAPVLATAAVAGVIVVALALGPVFAAQASQRIEAATATVPGSGALPVQPAWQLAMGVLYGLAVIGFLRRSEQLDDEFMGWLAIAAVLATASRVAYFLYPAYDSNLSYLGEAFCLLFYGVLLVGSVREIWLDWRALSDAAVLEERRRVARDLHDGLAQELAYLARNLDLLGGAADADTVGRLRRAVERAQAESRQALRALTAPAGRAFETVLAEAVSEIADRFDIELALDTVRNVHLSEIRAEAMVRIACEAVTNAARHSGASRVHLSLQRDGEHMRLRVSDAGRGFSPGADGNGFGLISMRERAYAVGGDLQISSIPDRGSQVEVVL
jgi:signal transduction histidine kinase